MNSCKNCEQIRYLGFMIAALLLLGYGFLKVLS